MSKNDATAQAFGYTEVNVVKFKYTWTINNFRFYCNNGTNKGLFSPTFSIDPNDGLTWCLEIYEHIVIYGNVSYYNIYKEQYKYIGLSLNCVSNNSVKPRTIECKFSILNGKGSVVQERVRNDILHPKSSHCSSDSDSDSDCESYSHFHSYVDYHTFRFPIFTSKTNLLNNLKAVTLNQSISVICEICASSESEFYFNQIVKPESDLPDPLELLFENPKFSDITLSADGTDFKVHKAILAAQSQVFEAMFSANMKENFSNRVEITDLNEVTLREVLRFIYTGKVLNLEDLVEDLFVAADKYALRTLKFMCETELNKQLSIANALSIFTLADMHSANQLKSYVKNFIRVHLLDVANTSEWQIMNREHPKLAKELLITP